MSPVRTMPIETLYPSSPGGVSIPAAAAELTNRLIVSMLEQVASGGEEQRARSVLVILLLYCVAANCCSGLSSCVFSATTIFRRQPLLFVENSCVQGKFL